MVICYRIVGMWFNHTILGATEIIILVETLLLLIIIFSGIIRSKLVWYILSKFKKPVDKTDKHIDNWLKRLIHRAFKHNNNSTNNSPDK